VQRCEVFSTLRHVENREENGSTNRTNGDIDRNFSLAFLLSPIPGDNPVHIAAHYAKTVYLINPLPELLHF
jgi:hypothetical protein